MRDSNPRGLRIGLWGLQDTNFLQPAIYFNLPLDLYLPTHSEVLRRFVQVARYSLRSSHGPSCVSNGFYSQIIFLLKSFIATLIRAIFLSTFSTATLLFLMEPPIGIEPIFEDYKSTVIAFILRRQLINISIFLPICKYTKNSWHWQIFLDKNLFPH